MYFEESIYEEIDECDMVKMIYRRLMGILEGRERMRKK